MLRSSCIASEASDWEGAGHVRRFRWQVGLRNKHGCRLTLPCGNVAGAQGSADVPELIITEMKATSYGYGFRRSDDRPFSTISGTNGSVAVYAGLHDRPLQEGQRTGRS